MSRHWLWILLALGAGLAVAQSGRFPSSDPNPRVGTPNDAQFDCNEQDDPEQTPGAPRTCSLFAEQNHLFGFAPNGSTGSATYKDAAHLQAGQVGQISGMSADRAWKITTGRPDVVIAILDTGIKWNRTTLRKRMYLNCAELPAPRNAAGATVAGSSPGCLEPGRAYDISGSGGTVPDGQFNIEDYEADGRADPDAGANGIPEVLDVQDLIADADFNDGVDNDGNGFIDDISGWDFFEDDHDPSDTTSYSAGEGHGTGRAEDAAEEGDDGAGGIGVCPKCRIMALRVWDTFVTPGDTWAAATVYAADNGAHVTESALGVLQNTRTAKAANRYAHAKNVVQMQVSSDLNTANHNYPTNYVESIYINGCIADAETLLGTEFGGSFGNQSVAVAEPVTTWFRNSGVTQYGAHAHLCNNAVTGSQATGLASGIAGMVMSRGLDVAGTIGGALTANEVKQLLTMTAEDVLPENTVGSGDGDFAQVGWDEHFGYGRADLHAAIMRIAPGKIPPEALITDPPWWHLLDPGATAEGRTVPVKGLARAGRSATCTYTLEWAVGIQPANSDAAFTDVVTAAPCPGTPDAVLGALPMDAIVAAMGAHARTGAVPNFTPSHVPESRPYATGRPNPNAHMFTVRLRVQDGESTPNLGEDRKVYLALHDPSARNGWPKFVDVGGESSMALYDLDHDGTLEVIDATSGGELCVYRHDGTLLPSFNGGACWQLGQTDYFQNHAAAPGFLSGAVPVPTSGLRTPAVADLDGDFEPEIVIAAADGRIYVLRNDGSVRLTLGVDPANSVPELRDAVNHPKRGMLAAPVLADLDGDGTKEIIAAAFDGFIYVWNGKTGAVHSGFPKEIRVAGDTPKARGELISTPGIADLFGDGARQIITSSSDFVSTGATPPTEPPPVAGGSGAMVAWMLAHAAGGYTRVYALHPDGSFVDGWPVQLEGLLPDVLPFVGPQHGLAIGDLDGNGDDEVLASITTGELQKFEADGSTQAFTSNGVVNGGSSSESTRILNLFEYAVVGNLNNIGGLDVAKLGITAAGAANLVAAGQNFKFNHVVQAWDSAATENYLPGYPTAIDDFGLLSTPMIADVNGDGTRDIVAGSGLYLLHAYGSTGQDVAGFPKQTGGWLFGVPAVGDLDGDGKLEMVANTREGWRFVWNLSADATAANNSEWWTEAHDECRSNNYGTDCRPPNRVVNLAYTQGAVQFVAPGDDWNQGLVEHYQLRTAALPITTAARWDSATPLPDVINTAAAGALMSIPFDENNSEGFVAVVAVDDAGNRAKFLSVAVNAPPGVLAGTVVAGAPVSVTGSPAAVLAAGSFELQNSGLEPHTISALELQLSDPRPFAALRLTGPNGIDVTVASPGVQPKFVLPVELTLAAGSSASFQLQATLRPATVAVAQHQDLNWMQSAHAADVTGGDHNAVAAAMLVALLLLMWVPMSGVRMGALAAVLLLAGCESNVGYPSANIPAPPITSTVKLLVVNANSGATPVEYQGLPVTLSTVGRSRP